MKVLSFLPIWVLSFLPIWLPCFPLTSFAIDVVETIDEELPTIDPSHLLDDAIDSSLVHDAIDEEWVLVSLCSCLFGWLINAVIRSCLGCIIVWTLLQVFNTCLLPTLQHVPPPPPTPHPP